jgi:hypothetical protein
MFHHFADELGAPDNLVRSTEFAHEQTPIASFITSVTQSGYVRDPTQPNRYLKKSLPPLEFEYSQADIDEEVHEIDAESLENLPYGLDGSTYQWVDLDGEGVSGILTEQADGWFYKRNLSPIPIPTKGTECIKARFAPLELVAAKPVVALASGHAQFLDLAGDGQLDLVTLRGPTPGFYERTDDEQWEPFTSFGSLPVLDWGDPDLKFVDLTGDGHADILISEDDALCWYPSLAEAGFGPAEKTRQALDEEEGPRLVFADGTQSIYLADMSGDGLTDLVRIRNGEVCYWPNLGYGRFGAKVAMDNAPWFDSPDLFDQRRIRLGDIDGSGTTDIIYLGRYGIDIYRNQSGNSWSNAKRLSVLPPADNFASVTVVDLLGNGTACLVWSSPLPGDSSRPMRYIDLMGGQKPHLLVKVSNNLGAETRVRYAPSTKFYLQDKQDDKPWITKLPFPVHVVELLESWDHVSRNLFITRYAFHHGYYDGEEREFRGFGCVEQWDTEEFAVLTESDEFPPFPVESEEDLAKEASNIDAASHVPPVRTVTWFHTGAYIEGEKISRHFEDEYYGAPKQNEPTFETKLSEFEAALLPDTVLPPDLTPDEEREACRALKGSMLRQEVYGLDGTDKEQHPYTVTEQNFKIECLQRHEGNRHPVFFTHPREALSYHYERNPNDPRIGHAVTLEVDKYGDVLKSVAIGYGRQLEAADATLLPEDREKQRLIHITCAENTFTNPIDEADAYRTPLPAKSSTYELRKPQQEESGNGPSNLYRFDDVLSYVNQAGDAKHDVDYEDILFSKAIKAAATDAEEGKKYFRRLVAQVRTFYRPDEPVEGQNDPLTLLPLGTVQPLALPGESYKLAFTPGLLDQVYVRSGLKLLPAGPADVLAGDGMDRGGYVDLDNDGHWWIPTGRVFNSPNSGDTLAQELAFARAHFFLPHRYRDPFGYATNVTYDTDDTKPQRNYNLLVVKTEDALGNIVTANNDYRVLQPELVTDPNGNRSQVAFDALGMVARTAVMGKKQEPDNHPKGDTLDKLDKFEDKFDSNLTQAQLNDFYDADDPRVPAVELLKGATTRIIYDLDRFRRTQQANPKDSTLWLPAYAATVVRENHESDLGPNEKSKVQVSFSYSDGFGREIQKQIQAEPGLLVKGGPVVNPRWVGSGWTIYNNKGKPVKKYEPFFDDTHDFRFDKRVGVSSTLRRRRTFSRRCCSSSRNAN